MLQIPASAVITTPRRQLPPIPVEQCQNISIPNDLPNEFDLNLSALSPFSSHHPRREHVSLGNLNLHKVSPTSHSELMEIDTPTVTIPETVGDESIQPTSEPSEPTTPQIQADTSSSTTTTKQMLEVLSELSETTLQENAAPPPIPSAHSDDVEGAPAEAEEEAKEVAPTLQLSHPQAQTHTVDTTAVEQIHLEKEAMPFSEANEEVIPPQASLSSIAAPNVADLLPKIQTKSILQDDSTDKVWKDLNYSQLKEKLKIVYEDMVFYKRNLFLIPTGKAGKDFIKELTFWLKQLNNNTKLNGVAVLAFMVLPSLLLQKPSAKSKAKDHSAALARRLSTWQRGEIDELWKEVKLIQQRFKKSKVKKSQDDVARIFSKLVMEGKVSAAMKFLDNEHSAGVLELNEETINTLKEKHPQSEPLSEQGMLERPIR